MAKLIECVPNFSCSREKDPDTFNALVAVAESIPGCLVFDVQTDGDHNRCVFTLVGTPRAMEEAAVQMTKKAVELIDMNHHKGQHPRMGAADVIPFIPCRGVTTEECVEVSKIVAERIWKEVGIPSYLYEDSATEEKRRNLATCRKGEFEGMAEKVKDPEWIPDYCDKAHPAPHPTGGVVAIGARFPLIAYNINLNTSDLSIAKKIAGTIRQRGGGFQYCKALGIDLTERNIVQVSMNLTNYQKTPIWEVFEMVRAMAHRYGVEIVGTEVVGLTPAEALLDCADFYLRLENFDGNKQIMELQLLEEFASKME